MIETSAKTGRPVGHRAKAEPTSTRIRNAAIDLFHERGFHAATMREVGDKAGIESATIYYHFDGKQALLFDIMLRTIEDLRRSAEEALAEATEPVERLRRFVANHVRFHAIRKAEAAIADVELDALDPPRRGEIVAGRDAYEGLLHRVLADGSDAGSFDVDDLGIVARAILTMATGVAVWYRPNGPLSPEAIGGAYSDLALRMTMRWPAQADAEPAPGSTRNRKSPRQAQPATEKALAASNRRKRS